MVFYRKNRMRRRRFRKRGFLYRKYSPMQLARSAYKGVRYLKGLVNAEKKKFDSSDSYAIGTTAVSRHFTGIAQGDGDNSRDGNSILCKGLSLRGLLTIHASAGNTQVRLVIVMDKQQVADSLPTMANVLAGNSIQSFLNKDTVGRFQILYDKVHLLDNNTRTQQFVKIWLPIDKHIRYNGTTSGDIQKNGLHIVQVSNEATNTPTITWTSRVYYYDN